MTVLQQAVEGYSSSSLNQMDLLK